MKKHKIFLLILSWLLFGANISATKAEPNIYVDAVLYGDKLISITDQGNVVSWNIKLVSFDSKLSASMSSISVDYIGTSGSSLWCISRNEVFKWDESNNSWISFFKLDDKEVKPIEIAVIEDTPYIIFPQKVEKIISQKKKQSFKVPNLKGQLKINYLRLLDMAVFDHGIWFGTGQGEWGGHLVHLDIDSGKWTSYYDGLHYATGIAPVDSKSSFVSWSMSHFMASTLIRVHGANAKPRHSFNELDSQYFQKIAFDNRTKTLYGVEQNQLVKIENGTPIVLADLGEARYDAEPNAIGVSPGVLTIIPNANGVVIVQKYSEPIVFIDGSIVRLSIPAQQFEPVEK